MCRTLLVVALLVLPGAANATGPAQQPPAPTIAVAAPGETQELVLTDGSRLYGRVDLVEGSRVTFRTTSGTTIEVDAGQIVSVNRVEGRVAGGAFQRADPNPTRLFFGPTGRSVRRGEAYVGVYEVFIPFVQVGLTDRISIGGGTPIYIGGGSNHPFWITPKIQLIRTKSTQGSIGVMHIMNVGDGNLGVAYGVVTRGSADSAVSVGLGYGYERSYSSNNGAGVLMIAGEHRISRGMKLITENYILEGGGLVSGGARWFGDHLSVDFGLVMPLGMGDTIALPMINFVWQFSRR